MDNQKVLVRARALTQRINRKLAKRGEKLLKAKQGSKKFQQMGEYYTIDITRNVVTGEHIDIEKLGRDLGAMKPYEFFDPETEKVFSGLKSAIKNLDLLEAEINELGAKGLYDGVPGDPIDIS